MFVGLLKVSSSRISSSLSQAGKWRRRDDADVSTFIPTVTWKHDFRKVTYRTPTSFFQGSFLEYQASLGCSHSDGSAREFLVCVSAPSCVMNFDELAEICWSRSFDEPVRIYVPMLMRPWIMQVCHAIASCHVGAARTLSMCLNGSTGG